MNNMILLLVGIVIGLLASAIAVKVMEIGDRKTLPKLTPAQEAMFETEPHALVTIDGTTHICPIEERKG